MSFPPPTKNTSKTQKSNKNSKTTKSQIKETKTSKNKHLNLLHVNAAGLNHKAGDLKNKIRYLNSSIISVQETQFRKKRRFKLDNFIVFESIRKHKEKGGSMLIVHKDLKPVLIK